MQCRIETMSEMSHTVVSIAGDLSGPATKELIEVRRSIKGAVSLDLENLISSGNEGIEAIRAMSLAGDEIRNASQYIQVLLQDDGPC